MNIGERVRLTYKRLGAPNAEGAARIGRTPGFIYAKHHGIFLVEWDNGIVDDRNGGWIENSLELVELEEFDIELKKWKQYFNE